MAYSWEDNSEATNVIYGPDKIIQRAVDTFYSLKRGCDVQLVNQQRFDRIVFQKKIKSFL